MYEFVITAGEGTLIELGVGDWLEIEMLVGSLNDGEELLVRLCDDDCETGQ